MTVPNYQFMETRITSWPGFRTQIMSLTLKKDALSEPVKCPPQQGQS